MARAAVRPQALREFGNGILTSKTFATLRTMLRGSWRDKVASRVENPGIIAKDILRVSHQVRRDLIRSYAAYHQKRQTSGHIYSIPGRQCRMWLPIAWGETVAQRRFGVYEPETFKTLDEIVRPGFVVIEIGACYGEMTIALSRLTGPAGHVYSFELFPPYFAIADRNVRLNGLTNVHLANRGVGRVDNQKVRVDVSALNPYASLGQISPLDYSTRTAGASEHAAHHYTEVDTGSLSSFLTARNLEPDLIFMDIEGGEVEVIYDLQGRLRAPGKRPMVYLELHRTFYGQAGVDWLCQVFDESGYSMRTIGGHLLCVPARDPHGSPRAPFSIA